MRFSLRPNSIHPLRRGAALVELSIVLPVLLALLIGSIEIGRGISVRRRCAEAARSGARVYSMRKTKTETDVRDMVAQIMGQSGLKNYNVTFSPQPSPSIKQLDPLKVTVSIDAVNASWVSAPWFLKGNTKISATCTMPADLGESAEGIAVTTPPVIETPTLIDDDAKDEGSGVTKQELKDLEKDAKKLVDKATRARADADKKQQEANDAAAKAAASGKKKDIEDAAKKQTQADEKAAKALAAEQLARDALAALTAASSKYKKP